MAKNEDDILLIETDDSVDTLSGLLWEKFAPGYVLNAGRPDYRINSRLSDDEYDAAQAKVIKSLKSFGVKVDQDGDPEVIPNTPSGRQKVLRILSEVLSKDQKLFNALQAHGAVRSDAKKANLGPVATRTSRASKPTMASKAAARLQRRFVSAAARARRQGPFSKAYEEFEKLTSKTVTDEKGILGAAGKKYPLAVRYGGFGGPLDAVVEGILSEYQPEKGKITPLGSAFSTLGFGSGGKRTGLAKQIGHIYEKDPELAISVLMAAIVYPGSKGAIKIDPKTGKITFSGQITSAGDIARQSNDFAQVAKILATGKINGEKVILTGSPTEKIVQAFLAHANSSPTAMLDRETRIKLALKEVKAGKYQSGDVSKASKPIGDKGYFVDTTGKDPELYRWNKATKSWVQVGAAPIQISRIIKGDQVLIDPRAADSLKKLFSSAERSISGSKSGKELVEILKSLGRRSGEIEVLAETQVASEKMRAIRKGERIATRRQKAADVKAIKDAAEINLSEILDGIKQTKFGKSIPKRGLTKGFIVSTIGKITAARIKVQTRLQKDRLEDMGRKGRLDDEREYARLLSVERSIINAYQGLRNLPASIRREIPALSTKDGGVERLPKLGMGRAKIINDPRSIYRGMSPQERQEEYLRKRGETFAAIKPQVDESKKLMRELSSLFGEARTKGYSGVLAAAEAAALKYSGIQSQVGAMTGIPLEGRQLSMLRGLVREDQNGIVAMNLRAGISNHINSKNLAIAKLHGEGKLFDVNGKVTAEGRLAVDDLMDTIKRYRPVLQIIGYGDIRVKDESGKSIAIPFTAKSIDAHERLDKFASIVFRSGGVVSFAQLTELGAPQSTAGNIIARNLEKEGKTRQEALEAVAQAEAAARMTPEKILRRLFAVSSDDELGRSARTELMGFLRSQVGKRVDPGAVDQDRIGALLSKINFGKTGLDFRSVGMKGEGTLQDIFKNIFPNESYSRKMVEGWFDTLAKEGIAQLKNQPGSATSGLVAKPLTKDEVQAETARMREQAKLAKAEEKAANARAGTTRGSKATGKLGTAAGVNEQGVPVDEKGRPFVVAGGKFAGMGGKPKKSLAGLGKYLEAQGLIKADQLVPGPAVRGAAGRRIDVEATAAAAKLGEAGRAMLSMVNEVRARNLGFDPATGVPVARTGAASLYGAMHGKSTLTPSQKNALRAATDEAMKRDDLRAGKSGMTASEWLASQMARAKPPSEKVLRRKFLSKFGTEDTLAAISKSAGVDLSPGGMEDLRSKFEAAKQAARDRRAAQQEAERQRKALRRDVQSRIAARSKWQESAAARYAAGGGKGVTQIDFGGQSPLPNRAAGILPTRAPVRVSRASAAAIASTGEATAGAVQAVAGAASGPGAANIPKIDMGQFGAIFDQIGRVKAPSIANMQRIVDALRKVQEILNTASGIQPGAAGRVSGGVGKGIGARLYNAAKGTGRPFRFIDSEQAQYQKATEEYNNAKKQALAASIEQLKSGAILGKVLPGVVRGGQKTTVGAELDRIQSEIFKGMESKALSRASSAVRAGKPLRGYASDAAGNLALGPELALQMRGRARASAVERMAQQFPQQLIAMQRGILQEARSAFRSSTAPIRSAAAQRAVSYDRFGGSQRPPARTGGFGGGGGGGFGGGRPGMPQFGGMGPRMFAGQMQGPEIGTQGVQRFANDAMGILGNLQQQIKFGFSQEITREISQALGTVLAHFKDGIIKFNKTLETSTVAFQTLFENQQKMQGMDVDVGKAASQAEFMVESIQRFANLTPFRFPELVEAARKMQAFGFETREILPNMQAIGDAVAALGGEDDKIRRITYALGQMRSAGRVYQNDMMQLANAGIAGYDILSRALLQDFVKTGDIVLEYNGKTIDQAYVQTTEGQADLVTATVKVTDKATRNQVKLAKSSSAEIGAIFRRVAEDPIEAIRDLTSSGKIGEGAAEAIIDGLSQAYGGGMKKLSKTFEGGMSTLADVSQYFVAQVTRPIFELTRDIVIDLGTFFQSRMAQKAVTQFADTFAGMVPAAEKTFRDVVDISASGVDGILKIFGGLVTGLDSGKGMSFLDRFGDAISTVADIMRTDLAKAIFGTIVAVKALSLAAGINPMLMLIGGILVGISALKEFADTENSLFGRNAFGSAFGSMVLALDSMKSTLGPMLSRIGETISTAFGSTFVTTLRLAVPILEKILSILNGVLRIFTVIPGMSEALGLGATYMLLRKMLIPINSMVLGSKSAIDPRTGMVVPGQLGVMGNLDQSLRRIFNNLYLAGGRSGFGGRAVRAAGFGPRGAEASMLSGRRFASMEARGALPAGGAARASGAFRQTLLAAMQNRGLAGARDVLGRTTGTGGTSVALRAGLDAGNFGATADEIYTRRAISLREAIRSLIGSPMGRIGEYYKRFRFGGQASTIMPKQLLLGPGNLQLPAGPINTQALLPKPNIAGLLPASAESLGLRLPDTSPIRPIAKMTLVERMFKASERYAEAVIRAHRPLIALANRIESIPGVLRSMANTIYHGIGRGMIKATHAIVYGPGNLAEAMVNSMRRLGSRVFHAMGRATISATRAIVYGPGNVGVAVIDSMQRLGSRVLDSVATRVVPNVASFGERAPAQPLGRRIAQGVSSIPGRALDFAARRFTVQSPIISSGLGPVSMFGKFQFAVGQFAGAVKSFAASAKSAVVAGGSSIIKQITSLGLPALLLAGLTKGKAGLSAVKNLATGGAAITAAAAKNVAVAGGKGLVSLAGKALGKGGILAGVFTAADAASRISSGEDAARVGVESTFDLGGMLLGGALATGAAALVGVTGGIPLAIAGIVGSMLGMDIIGGIGNTVADSLGLRDVAGETAAESAVDPVDVEKSNAIKLAFADTKLEIGEINTLLDSFDIRTEDIVGNMGNLNINALPTTTQMLGSLSERLALTGEESSQLNSVLALVSEEMTRQNQRVASGAGDWNAYKNAGSAALAELAIRLASMPKPKSVEELFQTIQMLATELGIKLDNKAYGLFNGAGEAADAANKKVSKLQEAVDRLRSAVSKFSSRLSTRIMMLFDKRMEDNLEKAKENLDATFEVVYEGTTTNIKALRDEIEAQEKKNKLLAIEKRIREATRNVEMARLAQYDASIDPLEAAARMREAEDAKTEAMREAALERKKIALEEVLVSKPYEDAVKDLEEKFEAIRLKFTEGMEDILAQLEKGKITGDEAIAKIKALYGESFALVGDLDADLIVDAAEFGDNFMGTWNVIIDKLKTVVDKFIKQLKRLRRAVKALSDPGTSVEDGEDPPPTTPPLGPGGSTLGDRPYDNWRGHGLTIEQQLGMETASMTKSVESLAKHNIRLRFMGIWQELQKMAAAGKPQGAPATWGATIGQALSMFGFTPMGSMRSIFVDAAKPASKSVDLEKRFAAGKQAIVGMLGKYSGLIPRLASGGTIMGPGMFSVGEAGRETLQVVPGGVARVFPRRIRPIHGIGAAGSGGGSINASVIINNPTVRNDQDIRKLAEEVSRAQRSLLRSSGVGRI
jgi:hypothetical protein